MARRPRPSLLLLGCSLVLLLPTLAHAADDDFFKDRLGRLGLNYNTKKGIPYIQCARTSNSTARGKTECPVDGPPCTIPSLQAYKHKESLGMKECDPKGSDFFSKQLGCMALFKVKNATLVKYMEMGEGDVRLEAGEYETMSGDCWLQQTAAIHKLNCLETSIVNNGSACVGVVDKVDGEKAGLAFCCCATHLCNDQIILRIGNATGPLSKKSADPPSIPDQGALSSEKSTSPAIEPDSSSAGLVIALAVGIPFLLLVGCCCAFCLRLRGKLREKKNPDTVPLVAMESGVKRDNLAEGLTWTEEVIAKGKMGTVHKGAFVDPATGEERPVAIKTIIELKSFLLEEAVYKACGNAHPHMARFIGSFQEHGNPKMYVVLEHEQYGNLEHYLKEVTFTPVEALAFLNSFMDGLEFLHSGHRLQEGSLQGKWKHPIVHRDIKSRNVLVKADRTAALADFGLGMICESGRSNGRHYQVGTHRYMSPELLNSMANLNLEGLKMADVYAASLIIWEILNRTIIDDQDPVQDAELPYTKEIEEYVVIHEKQFEEQKIMTDSREEFRRKPVQYYLHSIVHRDNKRPMLRERLKSHPITLELRKTLIDMWDLEVDGRISAACAHARFDNLLRQYQGLAASDTSSDDSTASDEEPDLPNGNVPLIPEPDDDVIIEEYEEDAKMARILTPTGGPDEPVEEPVEPPQANGHGPKANGTSVIVEMPSPPPSPTPDDWVDVVPSTPLTAPPANGAVPNGQPVHCS